mmetsp:Transcript_48320/g.96068  ORF Transcript_48320/g.96068 Transcript_48320/m.96068 type:complete len:247 (+) Transcript_48320:1553-2293(+)
MMRSAWCRRRARSTASSAARARLITSRRASWTRRCKGTRRERVSSRVTEASSTRDRLLTRKSVQALQPSFAETLASTTSAQACLNSSLSGTASPLVASSSGVALSRNRSTLASATLTRSVSSFNKPATSSSCSRRRFSSAAFCSRSVCSRSLVWLIACLASSVTRSRMDPHAGPSCSMICSSCPCTSGNVTSSHNRSCWMTLRIATAAVCSTRRCSSSRRRRSTSSRRLLSCSRRISSWCRRISSC